MILEKYPPHFVVKCARAVELSEQVIKDWLKSGDMFNELSGTDKNNRIKEIVSYLNNHTDTKIHSRHINLQKVKELQFNVEELETDGKLQDLVLSIHHSYMYTFSSSNAVKIIENQEGISNVVLSQAI